MGCNYLSLLEVPAPPKWSHPAVYCGCNYLLLPEIPASGNKVIIWWHRSGPTFTPGRLMKTTAVVFIREGDREKYRDFPHWFMGEVAIFKSSEFAYTQFMTPKVRYQSHGRVRWMFIEKLVIEISRWWRPLETGMKTTACVAGDLMKTTTVVD